MTPISTRCQVVGISNILLLGKVFGTVTTRQVPSTDPLTSKDASLLNAKEVTGRVWTSGTVIKTCKDLLLQIRRPISEELNAINFPSGLVKKDLQVNDCPIGCGEYRCTHSNFFREILMSSFSQSIKVAYLMVQVVMGLDPTVRVRIRVHLEASHMHTNGFWFLSPLTTV